MQGLTIDTLASKRIPIVSKMSSLPHLVAKYATLAVRESHDGHAAIASEPAAKAATPVSVASSAPIEQYRT